MNVCCSKRVQIFQFWGLLFAFCTLQQMLRILGAARLFCFLINQSIKQSIKWYLAKCKSPLAKEHNGRHADLQSQQDLMTLGKFATTGNVPTTYLKFYFCFFLSFSNMSFVPCDYQIVKN